jgi:hypothetical protein
MKLFRYRKPSLKTLLGITRAKKRLKRELGRAVVPVLSATVPVLELERIADDRTDLRP